MPNPAVEELDIFRAAIDRVILALGRENAARLSVEIALLESCLLATSMVHVVFSLGHDRHTAEDVLKNHLWPKIQEVNELVKILKVR